MAWCRTCGLQLKKERFNYHLNLVLGIGQLKDCLLIFGVFAYS